MVHLFDTKVRDISEFHFFTICIFVKKCQNQWVFFVALLVDVLSFSPSMEERKACVGQDTGRFVLRVVCEEA